MARDYVSMQEIEAIYSPGIGRHWFDADTKRFFRSRLAAGGYRAPDGSIFFVSSEQYQAVNGSMQPRRYTVRHLTGTKGNIRTIGEFQQYASASGANAAAMRFAGERVSA